MYTISSEIYGETNFNPVRCESGKMLSQFRFCYPNNNLKDGAIIDKDGDLDVQRLQRGTIEIEHSSATELKLVGLQVWRGALLLADYLFHKRDEIVSRTIMELGAGVGLTSIAAAIHSSSHVYCTDINLGCILQLIQSNINRNSQLLRGQVSVIEFDFMKPKSLLSTELMAAIDDSDIVLAADVIYDETLTNAFVSVMEYILSRGKQLGRSKSIYVALEKRFVFTVEDCESVAPMYEHFLRRTSQKPWIIEHLSLDFPQYFEYERCPQLILMRISIR